jgi:hypothetical protein
MPNTGWETWNKLISRGEGDRRGSYISNDNKVNSHITNSK